MSREQAEELLNKIGKVKPGTEKRRELKQISEEPKVRQLIKTISRAVIRKPDEEVLAQFHILHKKLQVAFSNMSDEALKWLLGGTSKTSFGGFQSSIDAKTQIEMTATQKLRKFLSTNPHTISPQKLISKIESLTTSMGYRFVCMESTEPPCKPRTEEENAMLQRLQELMQDYMVPRIGDIYTDRDSDNKPQPSSETVTTLAPDISSATDSDEAAQKPKERVADIHFRKNITKEHLSWLGAAHDSGVHIRAHVSGSAPLTLAAIESLFAFETEEVKASDWFCSNENAKKMSGAIIIATFERGDFHSVAESCAGVYHYLNERDDQDNFPMQPHQAFAEGLALLALAASKKRLKLEPKLKKRLSLSEAIKISNVSILKLIKKVDAHLSIDPLFDQKFAPLAEIKKLSSLPRDELSKALKALTIQQYEDCSSEIKNILEKSISQSFEFSCLQERLNHAQQRRIFKIYQDNLPKLIKSSSDVSSLLTKFNTRQKLAIYRVIRDQLPQWIESSGDFVTLINCLPNQVKHEVYLNNKDNLINIVVAFAGEEENLEFWPEELRDVINSLMLLDASDFCEDKQIKKMLPEIIQKSLLVEAPRNLLNYSVNTKYMLYEIIKNNLEEIVISAYIFNSLFSDLPKKRDEIYQKLAPSLPKLLKEISDVKLILNPLDLDSRVEIFAACKKNIYTLLENPDAFAFEQFLLALTVNECAEVCEVKITQMNVTKLLHSDFNKNFFHDVIFGLDKKKIIYKSVINYSIEDFIIHMKNNPWYLTNIISGLEKESCSRLLKHLKPEEKSSQPRQSVSLNEYSLFSVKEDKNQLSNSSLILFLAIKGEDEEAVSSILNISRNKYSPEILNSSMKLAKEVGNEGIIKLIAQSLPKNEGSEPIPLVRP